MTSSLSLAIVSELIACYTIEDAVHALAQAGCELFAVENAHILSAGEADGQSADISTLVIPLKGNMDYIFYAKLKSDAAQNISEDTIKEFISLAAAVFEHAEYCQRAAGEVQARDIYQSFAVHEIRTPLTTIVGYSQMLQKKLGSTDEKTSRWTGEIVKETKRLAELVETLLARK